MYLQLGDVQFLYLRYGKYMRLESYKHAQNHGIFAKNICGLRSYEYSLDVV